MNIILIFIGLWRTLQKKHNKRRTVIMSDLKQLKPGQTMNIGSSDHLTQIQHKINRVDIVDHFDHGIKPVNFHVVHSITSDGKIKSDY